jgi:cell division protein FtsI/penicillin-binding protein 2
MRRKIKNAINKMRFIKRELIVFLVFLLAFFVIISKVFSYTVLHYDYYKALADKQQM